MPPPFRGGYLGCRQHALILSILPYFQAKLPFLWSWRDSNLRPHRCERFVLTLRGTAAASLAPPTRAGVRGVRDQLNYKTLFGSIFNISLMIAIR